MRTPVIAKFYRPNRWNKQQIDEEHRFTQFLFDAEIPVVPPLIINEGDEYPTLATHDDFMFSIYPRQGGRAPELDNLDHLHQLGALYRAYPRRRAGISLPAPA